MSEAETTYFGTFTDNSSPSLFNATIEFARSWLKELSEDPECEINTNFPSDGGACLVLHQQDGIPQWMLWFIDHDKVCVQVVD